MVVKQEKSVCFQGKQSNKKKTSGKRVGKSRPEKANNQLNRRVK